VPFKLNQDRRHHIPRQKHKVTNWPAYEAGLRERGSVTVWFTDEAIAAWEAVPRTTRGGQPVYSALAILTALTLRAVFRLAYRQAEGLTGSIQCIAENGRMAWQKTYRYNQRAKVEATIGRWKQVIGDGLRSRIDVRRATEVDVAVHVLNRSFSHFTFLSHCMLIGQSLLDGVPFACSAEVSLTYWHICWTYLRLSEHLD
jgi:hypothetical protein